MNIKQAGRMLTLAYFLKTQVKENEFHMGSYMREEVELMNIDCGSTACALGYLPSIFPRAWKWNRDHPCLKSKEFFCPSDGTITFFGVTDEEHIFLFGSKHVKRTPSEEAKILEQFVLDHGYEYAN